MAHMKMDEYRETRKIEMRSRLSGQIRAQQRKNKMDVADLARATGMAENTIYRIKRGDVGATVDSIAAIADAFGIPPAVLLMPVEVDNG